MKAVGVFPGSREVRIIEHEEPRIAAPGEVKLRMLEVGVCGTDRDLCDFQFGSSPPGCDHFVLGHESLAEVVETAPGVNSVSPGDLVVAVVRKPCAVPGCEACRAGRQDFCASGHYRERGIRDLHGFMTGYVVEDEQYVYPVPRELRAVAVLVEPLTIAEKAYKEFEAIARRLPWAPKERTAVILGAGPVGILGAMLFFNAGFRTWVYSRSRAPNPKAEIVLALGAQYVSSLEETPAQLAARTGNIDVIYEAMGAPQAAFDVLPFLGANGVYVFTGVPEPREVLSLDLHRQLLHMILKNQVVMGTVNAGPDAFDAAIRDLAVFHRRWPGLLEKMITGRFPIDAYREAIFGKAVIKNVIELS